MKALVVISLMLAMSAPAMAQREMPKTVQLFDNATKEPIGTVTYSGRLAFFRNKWGVHFATVETMPDGKRTAYDPHGVVIDMSHIPAFK